MLGFGVSHKRLEQAVRELHLPVTLVREPDEADVVITLRNYFKQKAPALREAEERGLPIFVLKSNSLIQVESALTSIFALEVRSARSGAARSRGGDRPGQCAGAAGRAVAAERLHPPAPAPDGRARQPRLAVARARAVPPSPSLPGQRPRPARLAIVGLAQVSRRARILTKNRSVWTRVRSASWASLADFRVWCGIEPRTHS